MDFTLNDEQKMLKKVVKDFAEERILPGVKERDEHSKFDRSIFNELGELGVTGIVIDEAYGGAGMDYVSYSLVLQELARVDASAAVTISVHVSLGCVVLEKFGSEALKQRYLPKMTSGEYLAAYALSEPSAGSDVQGMKLKAEKTDGGYFLNGSKIWITSGGEADVYIVFGVTDPSAGSKGITCFLVEASRAGFEVGKKEDKMGLRGSPTTEIIFNDVFVPEENIIGSVGDGFKIAMAGLDGGRVGIASQATGIATGALEAAVDYANERETFNKKIILHQGVGFMIADMATHVEAARLLTLQAAHQLNNGKPDSRLCSMAKLFAGDTAMKVTTDAVQVFGGYGYTKEYPVERMMRDAKITQIYEGTQQIQRLVISRQLTK